MLLHFSKSLILLITLTSCSMKNFEKKILITSVPNIVLFTEHEAVLLRDYADKINKIDIDKILSEINNKTEKEKFKYRIVDLKTTYNKCVNKLQKVEGSLPKDRNKRNRELKEYMDELDAIWKYIIANYKI